MRTVLALLSALVIAAVAAPPASAVTRNCGNIFTPVGTNGPVYAIDMGCKTARYAARVYAIRGKAKTWRCTARPAGAGAQINCRRTLNGKLQRFRFQLED